MIFGHVPERVIAALRLLSRHDHRMADAGNEFRVAAGPAQSWVGSAAWLTLS
ncbi:hypothetical protein GCM10027614_33630 [Micromonospora vulcania]